MEERFLKLLSICEPFIFCSNDNLNHFKYLDNPFFKSIEVITPNDHHSGALMSELVRLDEITFGPGGMKSPKWVLFDCAVIPGGIFGYRLDRNKLPAQILSHFKHDNGLASDKLPISFYAGCPKLDTKSWFGHNLSSIGKKLGAEFRGLGLLTKVMGVSLFNREKISGATQWNSASLHIHAQIADLEIVTARALAHTHHNTFVYRHAVSEEILKRALSGRRETGDVNHWLGADDQDGMAQLQKDLEHGKQVKIVGRPQIKEQKVYIPLNIGN